MTTHGVAPEQGAETDPAVVAALLDPGTYPHRPARVEHVQTHISHVFLAGEYVYKLKKAVRFPFLDFSTLAARRHFCAEELRLNRRLAAPIYLEVVALVRTAEGRLVLGGEGALVEPVLRMRRLPAERLLPALLDAKAVDAAMMAALARRLVAFHRAAPTGPAIAAYAAPDALRARVDETLAILARFIGPILHADEQALLTDFATSFVRTHEPLLRARQDEGRIREGHGDLHAEHVCFVEEGGEAARPGGGSPALPAGIYVFDCIEFSEAFRCNDVASEIAFLTMDLEFRGRRDLAEAFAAAYVAAADDPTIARLLPYYAVYRACVRAVVACLTSAEDEVDAAARAAARERAAAYVALAIRSAWRAGDPVLIACSGLSGTGKSTVAAMLADVTDATVLRSDAIRKRDPAAPPSAARYGPAARAAVYTTLLDEAEAALAAGRTVIADATFLRRADRDALVRVAARHGRRAVFVETVASPETVRARLDARPAGDLSDARFDTYLAQQATAEPYGDDEPRLIVATDGPLATVRATARRALFAWR